MIKAEVIVDGDWLKIGNRSIRMNQYLDWVVLLDGVAEKQFRLLEDAIKHCLARKYDWSVIPAHVNFMATDEDGMACGWLVEPHIVGNAWRNQSHLSAFFNLTKRQNPFRGDWKDSLEKRPDYVEPVLKDGA